VRPALDRDGAVHVRHLALAERIDARLHADARPRDVERAVEPEARLVLEHHDAAAGPRFFLIAGRRARSQYSCASASARASRLRRRCTENPSWCSRRGMCVMIVVANAEALLDDVADHRPGPHARAVARGQRPRFDDRP
jgi:hypothetical protein